MPLPLSTSPSLSSSSPPSSSSSMSSIDEEREKIRALNEIAVEIDRVMVAFEKSHGACGSGKTTTATGIGEKLRAQLGLYLATNGIQRFLSDRSTVLEGDETYENIVAEVRSLSSQAFQQLSELQRRHNNNNNNNNTEQQQQRDAVVPPVVNISH